MKASQNTYDKHGGSEHGANSIKLYNAGDLDSHF
jgi:hypothetical protein